MKQAATLFFFLFLLSLSQTSTGSQLPAQSLYQLLAAEMALDRAHPDIALANYIAAAKETQDPNIAARATQIALSIASFEVAIEPATLWAKADPKNVEAQVTAGALYIRMHQAKSAVPYLAKAEEGNAEEAFQYFLILFRQLQNEESKTFIEALQLLAKKEKTIFSAHLALAEIDLYLGDTASALARSHTALKGAPDSLLAIQLVGESLFRTKGKTATKAFLEKQMKHHSTNSVLRQYYLQFLLENNFLSQAHKEMTLLAKEDPLDTETLLNFARLSMQAKWFDLAKEMLLRAKKRPDNPSLTHYFLARLAEMQNQDEKAIEWYQQVLTGPFYVLSHIRASILFAEGKKYDKALATLFHIQTSEADDKKQILLAQVDILNKAKRYHHALSLLNHTIKKTSLDLDLLYQRSLICDQLNHLIQAEKDLKAILVIQPEHLNALNTLGFILINKTKRFDEGKKYLSKALQLSPHNASVLDSMGWFYYKTGDYQKSLTILKKAASITPNADIAAHLGEVLWHMKDFEAAKRVWDEALTQYPQHENIINVMQRLIH